MNSKKIGSSESTDNKRTSRKRLPIKDILRDPVSLLAFGLGSGFFPKAPGTMGTLACVPLYVVTASLDLPLYLALCVFMSVIGIFICEHASKKLGVHDHPGIVWDEFAGFMITMIAVPFSWQNVVLGFILFRIFDIFKPWPINLLDRQVGGGLGIMLDDILAGIFSLITIHGVLYLVG